MTDPRKRPATERLSPSKQARISSPQMEVTQFTEPAICTSENLIAKNKLELLQRAKPQTSRHHPKWTSSRTPDPPGFLSNSKKETVFSFSGKKCMQVKDAQVISNSGPAGSLAGTNSARSKNQIGQAVMVPGRSLLHNKTIHSSSEGLENTVRACKNDGQFEDAEEEFYHPEPEPIVKSGMPEKSKQSYELMMEAFHEGQTILPENAGPAPVKKKQTNDEEAKGFLSTKNNLEFVLGRAEGTTDQIFTNHKPWETQVLDFKAYKNTNGHTNLPQSKKSVSADSMVALCLKRQRGVPREGKRRVPEKMRRGVPEKMRRRTLQNQYQAIPWEIYFLELKAYKDQNGHANPKRTKTCSDSDYKLAQWLAEQRYSAEKLSIEKIQKLKALGCSGFGPKSERKYPRQMAWETRFLDLVAYKQKNGHTKPHPSKKSAGAAEHKLAAWLNHQLQAYRKGKLELEKILKLKNLGCSGFDPDSEKKYHQQIIPWETRFLELVAYKQKNGHANPPQSKFSSAVDYSLAVWLQTQRDAYRKERLVPEKTQRLNDLGCFGFDVPFYLRKSWTNK